MVARLLLGLPLSNYYCTAAAFSQDVSSILVIFSGVDMFIKLNQSKATTSKMISPHCEACNPIMYLVELHFYGKNTYLTRIN